MPEENALFRTPDFRYYYANGVHIKLSDKEFQMAFGINEDHALLQQCAVILLPEYAKKMAFILQEFVKAYEMAHGEIQLDTTRLHTAQAIKEMIDAASAAAKK